MALDNLIANNPADFPIVPGRSIENWGA